MLVGLAEGGSESALHLPEECVQALEPVVSFEANVVPGAGAVVVGMKVDLDGMGVCVDLEQQVAGPSASEASNAVLQVVDVMIDAVEELVPCVVVPVVGGAGAAEGVEEVL